MTNRSAKIIQEWPNIVHDMTVKKIRNVLAKKVKFL